jgi:endo-1,3(4)-beta-glucanase
LFEKTSSCTAEFYFWGGTVNSKARLALIADSLNRPDLVAPVVQYLKTSIGYWLQNNSVAGTQAAYETTWGGVVNKQGATSFWVDFGNGYYNDHHFHYGYFLTIAATIAKFDSAWLNQYRDYINWFARCVLV